MKNWATPAMMHRLLDNIDKATLEAALDKLDAKIGDNTTTGRVSERHSLDERAYIFLSRYLWDTYTEDAPITGLTVVVIHN